MPRRLATSLLCIGWLTALSFMTAGAQERPAKRIANIVGVAMEEYSKAIGQDGQLVSDVEYGEAVDFLTNARELSLRLSGDRAGATRALIDSLLAAVRAKVPPPALAGLRDRFAQSLGADAALDVPTRIVDVAAGQRLYQARCASCHGATALGDGPAARGMQPPPPALGSAAAMRDVTPALMYRFVSVGVAGTPMPGFAEVLSTDERWDIIGYLLTLQHPRTAMAQGEGIFALQCSGCHGSAGLGDGLLARTLSKLPPEIGTFAWQAERSDAQLVDAIRNGVPGTAMPPSRALHEGDVEGTVAYLRQLALRDVPARANGVAGSQRDPEAVLRQVRRTLDEALGAARAGRASDATDRAFDAYLAFEPIETPARAKNPGLVASVERQFADFRAAIAANDVRTAERARNAIETALPDVAELMRPTGGWWGAFLQSLLIILREGLEAILVIGAIVAFLIKTGHRERLRSIWVGTGLALVASAVTAVIFATALRALPASREIIEGITMLIAVVVLFSVSYWLISKVEAAKWQQFIREKVTAALAHGGGTALALVAFLAVYREGAETALFYQVLFTEGGNFLPITLGIIVGGAVLTFIFVLFHRYGVRIPLRPFFGVTSALLYYLAFVFMGKGIRELQEGNVVTITVVPGLPHIDAMGIYPTLETLGAQLVLVLLFAFALLKTFWPKRSVALPTVEPDPAVIGDLASAMQRLEAMEARVKQLERELSPEPRS
ncbi:MAG: FTR1 family protein [Gemmatimonadaceae bacterium]